MSNLSKLYKRTLEERFKETIYAKMGYELDFSFDETIVQLYDGDKLHHSCSCHDMIQYLGLKSPSLPWVK